MFAYFDSGGGGAGGAIAIVVVVWLICGAIGYAIGNSKGRAGAGLALGLLLGIIGIIIIAVMQPSAEVQAQRIHQVVAASEQARASTATRSTESLVPCPSCAEMIQPAAKVCRFCGRDVAE